MDPRITDSKPHPIKVTFDKKKSPNGRNHTIRISKVDTGFVAKCEKCGWESKIYKTEANARRLSMKHKCEKPVAKKTVGALGKPTGKRARPTPQKANKGARQVVTGRKTAAKTAKLPVNNFRYTNAQLAEAAAIRRDKEESWKEIARMIGVKSPFHFSKVVREHYPEVK